MHNQRHDAIIVGAGHNGLVCACYLAAAGLKVRVVEKRHIVGGAAVTEEFYPGFRNSIASYTVSLLHPKVIKDLRLEENGLTVLNRPMANFLPLPNGDAFCSYGDERTQSELARFSPRDAEQLPRFYAMLDAVAGMIREGQLETPPNQGGGLDSMISSLRLGWRWRKLSKEQQRDFHELMTRSAGYLLDNWFESDPIKAQLGFDSVVGNFGSPYSNGSGYVLLHHVIGEANGRRGAWGHAVGGMGAITQAMAKEARQRGVDIQLESPVSKVLSENNHAIGVELESGETLHAPIVVSNLNPSLLFENLVPAADLSDEFLARMKRYRSHSGTFRINVALSELPDFSSKPSSQVAEHHQTGIILAPSLEFMDRAFTDAVNDGYSKNPIIEMMIPSTVDATLAPAGAHVAGLFCQHFQYRLPKGMHWDQIEHQVADDIFSHVDRYAPNFKRSIIGYEALSPMTLETRFGLTGGDIFHGALGLDQLFSARPLLGYADYRSPIKGLYQCGSGTHPGGGVSGVPGHNAAREIVRDKRRWWKRSA